MACGDRMFLEQSGLALSDMDRTADSPRPVETGAVLRNWLIEQRSRADASLRGYGAHPDGLQNRVAHIRWKRTESAAEGDGSGIRQGGLTEESNGVFPFRRRSIELFVFPFPHPLHKHVRASLVDDRPVNE